MKQPYRPSAPHPSPPLLGLPLKRLPLSRTLPAFIAAVALCTAAVYLTAIAPRWSGTFSPLGMAVAPLLLAVAPLHLAAARSDPGHIVKPGGIGGV